MIKPSLPLLELEAPLNNVLVPPSVEGEGEEGEELAKKASKALQVKETLRTSTQNFHSVGSVEQLGLLLILLEGSQQSCLM